MVLGGMQWRSCHIKFHEIRSSGSKVEMASIVARIFFHVGAQYQCVKLQHLLMIITGQNSNVDVIN